MKLQVVGLQRVRIGFVIVFRVTATLVSVGVFLGRHLPLQ